MCSILGLEEKESDLRKLATLFARSDSRGPDGTRFYEGDHA